MGNLGSAFNTSDVADDIWSAGDYLVEITKSEMKDTKDGNGKYLMLGFKCLEGKQKGQMIFTNINLINPNEIAVQIARKELKKICTAVGKTSIEDSDELHAIPLKISIVIRSDGDPYPGNDIKKYTAVGKAGGGTVGRKNPFKK